MTKTVKNELLHYLNFLKSIGYDFHENLNILNKDINQINLPNDINALENMVKNCYLCELSKGRKNVVFASGNTNSDIMFIGDTPSSTENELGKLFGGRSGEILIKMIENVLKISKNDVYVSNIVKCKVENRTYTKEEANLCKSYLLKQIQLVNPKIIVALGEEAYNYLSDDNSPISKVRGQILNYDNRYLVPTYHPTFLLRNPSLKKESYIDMLKIKNLMEKVL